MILVEDGSGVEGANSLVHPAFAAEYHSTRGGLDVAGEYEVTAAVFTPPYGVTVPSNGANVPSGSIVEFAGASDPGNVGYGIVTDVDDDDLTVRWMDDMASETSDVTLYVFDQSGWWAARRRLEASLVNATEYLGSRPWYGEAASDVQGTPFPRTNLVVRRSGQFYKAGTLLSEDEVPLAVKFAVCHLALEDLNRGLAEVVDPTRQLKSKRIGPISKTWENPTTRWRRRYPVVDRMLRGLSPGRSTKRPLGPGG